MLACLARVLTEAAVQKPVKATNVGVRQAGAAPPAPSVRTRSSCDYQVPEIFWNDWNRIPSLQIWTTALRTRATTEAPARTWLMATSATVLRSGWGKRA